MTSLYMPTSYYKNFLCSSVYEICWLYLFSIVSYYVFKRSSCEFCSSLSIEKKEEKRRFKSNKESLYYESRCYIYERVELIEHYS